MALRRLRVFMYAPFIANNSVGAGPHQALTIDQKLEALFDHLKLGYFGQVDGPDVLPLFLAPEWYFSPDTGCYQASDVGRILTRLLEQSRLFPKALIVAGSIAWGIPLRQETTATPRRSLADLFRRSPSPREMVISGPTEATVNAPLVGPSIVYNTVPIISNGRVVHIYHKRREGGELSAVPQGSVGFQFPIPGYGSMERFGNDGLFSHEGIQFGVEVCADHANGELYKSVVGITGDAGPTRPAATGLDVQILVACGTEPMPRLISAVRTGGYFVHCEGSIQGDEANKKAAMYVAKIQSRTGSLIDCYSGAARVTLAPTKTESRTSIDTYRRYLGGDTSATRVGIFKTVCEL